MKNYKEINQGIIDYNYSWEEYPRTPEEIEIDNIIDSWIHEGKPTAAFYKAIQTSYEANK